jgi:hypothetical protein
MELQQQGKIQGLPNGLLYGQNDRTDELNKRILQRNQVNTPLAPHYDPRPVETKRMIFPVLESRHDVNEPKMEYTPFQTNTHHFSGNRKGPHDGFARNVEHENLLRNQYFALQHGASQGVYVPSSESSLYKVEVPSTPSVQPHKQLFATPQFSDAVHPNLENTSLGRNHFFNHTRTQLRNSGN